MFRLLLTIGLFFLLSSSHSSLSYACTLIIVGKKASLDGSIKFGRNSDTSRPSRAKNLKIYPATELDHARFIALPYHDTESRDGMLQVATNDFGVAISATQSFTSDTDVLDIDPFVSSGVSEANLVLPLMRAARSASEAIHLLGQRIEKEGAAEGFGVAVADKDEVWYLETASAHHWAAARIPDDAYFISANQGRLQEIAMDEDGNCMPGFKASNNLLSFAKESGLYQESQGKFDFRKTFQRIINDYSDNGQDDIHYNYRRLATIIERFSGIPIDGFESGEFDTFLYPNKKISKNDIASALSDFYEGSEADPFIADTKFRPISVFRASNSHITAISEQSIIQYIALGMPSFSIYMPFYSGMSQVPPAYQGATAVADDHSAFWKFRKLQALVLSDKANLGDFAKQRLAEIAQELDDKQFTFEFGPHSAELIDDFTSETADWLLANIDELRFELESIAKKDLDNEGYQALTQSIFEQYPFPGF